MQEDRANLLVDVNEVSLFLACPGEQPGYANKHLEMIPKQSLTELVSGEEMYGNKR